MISTTAEEYNSELRRIEQRLKDLIGDKLKARQIRFVEAALFNIRLPLAMGALKAEPDSLAKAVYGYGYACMLLGVASALDDVELIETTKNLKESIGLRVDLLMIDIGDTSAATESLHGKEQE